MRQARVLAICAGRAVPEPTGSGQTAIDKRPVEGPLEVGATGLAGDEQGDAAHHGGADQALYVYAEEDADHWRDALGRELPAGSFGENLRTLGLEVTDARIGERWRLGDVEVQVTAPRIPCRTFADFWDVPDLVARFLSAGRPGAYLRVLEPGSLEAGATAHVVDRPDHDVTVAEVLRIHTRDRGEAARLLEVDGLAVRARRWAESQVTANG